VKLRDYQQNAIDALYAWFSANNGNPLLVLPTGSGKSHIIAGFIHGALTTWPDQRVLMLTHVKELIEQNTKKLVQHWPGAPVGVYSAGLKRREHHQQIIFAGIQSVYNRAVMLGKFDLILIDECHLINHQRDGMYRSFIADMENINPLVKVIGLTATPFRTRSGDLTKSTSSLFTDVAFELPLMYLVTKGYLSPLVSKKTNTEIDLSGVRIRDGEFIQKDLVSVTDQTGITQAAVSEIIKYGKDRRSWLIFCAGIDHANHVADELNTRGIRCGVITSRTRANERIRIIREYKSGLIQAITNANVLTTGFDAPSTDLIAFLRATHSPGLYVQMAGRGMRLSPGTGKTNCLVLDFAGNVARHGPVDTVKAWVPGNHKKQAAPVKACPDCQTLLPVQARTCTECGYVFEFNEKPKHEKTASSLSVLSALINPADYVKTHQVDAVRYSVHKKPGKPDSLKVSYQCGLRFFHEWVCPFHGGIATRKAEHWLNERVLNTTHMVLADINSISRLISLAEETLKAPTSITVNESSKYPEIIKYDFSNEQHVAADAP